MTYPPRPLRHVFFTDFVKNGGVFDQTFAAWLDAEISDLGSIADQMVSRFQAITTASGQLRNVAVATAMSLVGAQTITATASQTVFLTSIVWDSAFTPSGIIVTQVPAASNVGTTLLPSAYTVAPASGELQVTLSGVTVVAGDRIVIRAFSAGAGLATVLASTAHAQGASTVGVEDIDSLYTATTVEGCLAEIRAAYNATVSALGTLTTIWHADGKTVAGGAMAATADWDMGGYRLTNLGNATADQDAVTFAQLKAYTLGFAASTANFLNKDGTVKWAAAQNADGNKLQNLVMTDPLGTTKGEATNQPYVQAYVESQISAMRAQVAAFTSVTTAIGKRMLTYNTAGTYTYTVQDATRFLSVEMWGGGGYGTDGRARPGAGAGAYIEAFLTLSVGDVLSLVVGAGGTTSATVGGDSILSVNGVEVARAGGGLSGASSDVNGGTGTLQVSPYVTGGYTIPGGSGGAPTYFDGAGAHIDSGGYGGSSPRGGPGGSGQDYGGGVTAARLNGRAPGGGGGGGANDGAGGNGAAGAIHLRY